jgi:hypothetical protein
LTVTVTLISGRSAATELKQVPIELQMRKKLLKEVGTITLISTTCMVLRAAVSYKCCTALQNTLLDKRCTICDVHWTVSSCSRALSLSLSASAPTFDGRRQVLITVMNQPLYLDRVVPFSCAVAYFVLLEGLPLGA